MNMQVSAFGRILIGSLLAILVLRGVSSNWRGGNRPLAESLANDSTQSATVASIVALGEAKVPLLLSWTRTPPAHILPCGLNAGLADTFGQLKTEEAIPFLIGHISLLRSCGVSLAPWLKVPETIEWNLPCAGALVKIGPQASKALIKAFPGMSSEEDRRAALFVISRVKGVQEAQDFLNSVRDRADRESYWAEEGMKLLRR
jgi:hypothetical protein